MAKALQDIRQVWERTGLLQRVLLLGILLGCIGAAVLLVGWARKPHMALLYSGLDAEEAAKIVEKVRDAGVPYELTAGGTTINVPAEKVYSLRLTMASAGLPTGQDRGYGILDKGEIGTSPFKERINLTRAIEGELAKTIQLLEGVSMARVHVVRPESTLFAGQKKNASATVAVRTKPGWRLTPSNVAAIIHLVVGSVEGMTPEKVVVVDARGRLLSGGGGSELAGKAGTFLDYKSRVEEYLSDKAEDMLAVALGPNRASVRIDAVIETSRVNETIETYDPDKRVITKEEIKSKSSVPVAPAAAGAAKPGTKTSEENTVSEYRVSRTVKQKTDLPGKVMSLTVAAFVDLSPPPKPEGSEEEAPAPTLTVKEVEEIIRNAIGLKATDTLKVVSTKFPASALSEALDMPEEAGGFTDPDFLLEMARRFSLGILVIGALLALRIFRGSKKKSEAGAAAALEGQPAGQPAGLLPGGSLEANPELLKSQISNALQENPDEVKRLFLSWVNSESGGA